MIHVLHVVDSLAIGGLERGVANLVQRLDPSRFTHSICAVRGLGPLADPLRAAGAKIYCLERSPAGYTFAAGKIAALIKRIRPDVVHSRNWGTIEAVLGGRLARKCAIIHSEHGLESATLDIEPRPKLWFRRLAFESADQVFAVSNQLRQYYAARTGFPERRIDVIHNGVDTDRFRPSQEGRRQIRAEFGVSETEFCIGAVGRLQPIKDHMTLLRAATALPPDAKRRVLIAGGGGELDRLKRFVNDQPRLRDIVVFAGEFDRIPEFLSALDAYVLPSIFEGISNSLLEAMSTGLPVIATATGGNPEVVEDGVSGLMFGVGNAEALASHLSRLGQSPALRAQLGRGAIQRVKDGFSLAGMLDKYEQLYCGLSSRLNFCVNRGTDIRTGATA